MEQITLNQRYSIGVIRAGQIISDSELRELEGRIADTQHIISLGALNSKGLQLIADQLKAQGLSATIHPNPLYRVQLKQKEGENLQNFIDAFKGKENENGQFVGFAIDRAYEKSIGEKGRFNGGDAIKLLEGLVGGNSFTNYTIGSRVQPNCQSPGLRVISPAISGVHGNSYVDL